MTSAMNLDTQVQNWIAMDPDADTVQELRDLLAAGDTKTLGARFGGRMQFGTAGIRGVVGAGPMRMNRLVIRQTSAGLARYLTDTVEDAAQKGIVVAYDARPDSRQFAEDAAGVFVAHGFRVFLTDQPQPTPVGAYAVIAHGAAAGVVVTASHNPPEYNGYKVYWENGAQIIPPHDSNIARHIDAAATQEVPCATLQSVEAKSLVTMLDDTFTVSYRARIVDALNAWKPKSPVPIRVAYTALHGVGANLAETLFKQAKLGEFSSVASQHEPDGRFPTVAFPNPEEAGAMDAVIALASSTQATLACANDPDADRLAVAARTPSGKYDMLTGDQIGILLGDYCLSKTNPAHQIVCASMVSSRMLGRIATSAGATYFDTLTGFKWLANIALHNESEDLQFLFAYEEALGYALGQLVRDKDGLSAFLLFCQMTTEYAANNLSVFDRLETLYRKHGLFLTHQHSLRTTPGQASITGQLRAQPPVTINGIDIEYTRDLQQGVQTFADGTQLAIDGHPTDTIVYCLADDSRVIVRPSGTEPKTKCYYEVVGTLADDHAFEVASQQTRERLDGLVTQHQSELAALLG